jgi:DNA primase
MPLDRSRLPDPLSFYEAEGLVLKGQGPWRATLCKFHDDHDPSLHINIESGRFSCKACGAEGSMIDYVMRTRGLEFCEACKALGAWVERGSRVGVPVLSQRQCELKAVADIGEDMGQRRATSEDCWQVLMLAARHIHSEARGYAALEREVLTVWAVGSDLHRGQPVSEHDWSSLTEAVRRIEASIEKAHR